MQELHDIAAPFLFEMGLNHNNDRKKPCWMDIVGGQVENSWATVTGRHQRTSHGLISLTGKQPVAARPDYRALMRSVHLSGKPCDAPPPLRPEVT